MNGPRALPKFWRGYVAGTNRGNVLLRISQSGTKVAAKAILLDHLFGSATMWFKGDLNDAQLELRMTRCKSKAPINPLDGKVSVKFDVKSQVIEGTWQTEIGTSGVCRFESSDLGWPRWIFSLIAIKLRTLRLFAFIYVLFLLACAVAGMVGHAKLSWPTVVLILVPAPFLFTSDLARLIATFRQAGVRKAGPFEFEQNPPSAEVIAIATRQAQANIAFAQLNQFLVLRTKILLAVLAHANGMPLAEFGNLARSFGVAEDNVATTLQAMIETGCAQVHDDRVVPTPWGRRYVHEGLQLA